MSLLGQALNLLKGGSERAPKSDPAMYAEFHLTDATARTEEVHWGGDGQKLVRVDGRDESGQRCSLAIEFEEPHRGKAAVFVDEVRRTGAAVLRGSRPSPEEAFRIDDALSGEARLGPEHRAFSPLRSIGVGISSLSGRTPEAVELDAVAALRSARDGSGR